MVVLEAQAFGLPTVVADVGGPPEIVTHGRTGYALPSDDPEIWLQTLTRLVEARRSNPADYARWREEIRTAARSNENWETLLNDIMGPSPTRSPNPKAAVPPSATRLPGAVPMPA
jgi:glycosyltransferase involved in cell wall biosynthesis